MMRREPLMTCGQRWRFCAARGGYARQEDGYRGRGYG